MEASAVLAMIAGFVAPWVIALVNRPDFSSTRKRVVTVAVCAPFGIIAAIVSGQLDGIPTSVVTVVGRILVSVGVVIIASQPFYAVFKPAVKRVEGTPRDPS